MPVLKYYDVNSSSWKTAAVGPAAGAYWAQTIGDGASSSFPVTHGLATRNVQVVCYRNSPPYDEVDVDVQRTTEGMVTINTLPTVPAVSEYIVVVQSSGQQLSSINMDSWHTVGQAGEPAFSTIWNAAGGIPAGQTARFRKYPDGRVRLAGLVNAGSSFTFATNGVLFTLPVGYRPPVNTNFITSHYDGTDSSIDAVRLYITPAGAVTIAAFSGPSYSGGANTQIVLDGIEFDTESVLQTASVAAQPLEGWHTVGAGGEPAFQNSWTHYGGSVADVGFRKDPTGKVQLRGLPKNGTGTPASVIFTLPVGYRPPKEVYFPVLAYSGSAYGVTQVFVKQNGDVVAYNVPFNAQTGTGYVGLDDVEFDTESVTTYQSASIQGTIMDSWHLVGGSGEPAFQNAWVNDTGMVTKFRKYPDGRVRLAGRIKTGTIGQAAFVLPAGYRPSQALLLSTVSNNGSADVVSDLQILTDGSVIPRVGSSANWFTLEGIEFDTESVLQVVNNFAQPMDGWHVVGASGEPAFLNSWANFGGAEETAGFRKYPDGRVRLQGLIATGANGTTIFTLPAGYRPPKTLRFPVLLSGNAIGAIVISSDGSVASSATSSTWTSLTGIEFDTELVSSYPSGFLGGPTKVYSLPTSAVDGQEIYYVADAANGVIWHLRYNALSASPYKWEFVGGPPLWAEVTTQEASNSGTYGALATAGPSVTLPLAGDYMVTIGAETTAAGDSGGHWMSYDIGGTGAVDADAIVNRADSTARQFSSSRIKRKNGLAAVTLTAKYKRTAVVAAYFSNRHISVMPVRVG